MVTDDGQENNRASAGGDQLVELESNGELDGNGLAVYRPRWERGDSSADERALVLRSVTRPLLPYQRALCETLGISEAEYHDFLAIQRDWRPSEAEQLQELRMEPVSIILAVVGIIFQVVGMLLAPKPPDAKNQPTSRNKRFAPRYGFNSTQELAKYGDAIPLVYCNKGINPRGIVRVTAQLLWSAVESDGSAQFMQLLLLVGAAQIRRINYDKIAFGQMPLGEIKAANTWVYYSSGGGGVQFVDKVVGDGQDPSKEGLGDGALVHQIKDGNNWHVGFSQALTPSGKTSFGVYSPIPINVRLGERRQSGRLRWADNEIEIAAGNWDTGGDGRWQKGDKFRLVFRKAREKKDNLAQEAAKDMRYQLVSNLDRGSTYMLGSALFKINYISDNLNIDKGDVYAQLECVQKGRRPSTDYGEKKALRYDEDDLEKIENAFDVLKSPASEVQEAIDKARVETDAVRYSGISATMNRTQASEYEQSDEELYEVLQDFDVKFAFVDIKYEFAGFNTIQWKDDLDQVQTFTYYEGGSLAYSRRVLRDFLADKPKLKTKELRQEYDDDLERARELRDRVNAGRYNKQFRNEAKSEKIAQQISADIRYRQDRRRWSESAKEGNNDKIDELEKRIDAEKEQKKPNNDRIKGWRREIRELRRGREFGDEGEKKGSDEKIDDLQAARQDFLDGNVGERRDSYVYFVRNATSAFIGLDGNRYACGIKCLKRKLNQLKGEWTTDQVGVNAVKAQLKELIKQKEEALKYAKWIVKNWETLVANVDDTFFTKCIVKADTANYQTVTACDYVKLNIRSRLYRRISGRSKTYGSKDAPDGYRYSDNGVKGRMAFWSIRYRRVGEDWNRVPTIFAMVRAADTDNFVTLKFETKRGLEKWEFELAPILDPAAEVKEHGYPSYTFVNNGGKSVLVGIGAETFQCHGEIAAVDDNGLPKLKERGPMYTNEWDMFSNRSDTEMQSSSESGAEFALVNVTEQQRCASALSKYRSMSLLAVHAFSGAGVQDLQNVTAYTEEGKTCWIVDETTGRYQLSNGSTSWAADIFADTILDKENGIGQFVNPLGIDWQGLAKAKRFCRNNGLGCQLFMDGVLAQRTSWREFWVEAAPYSLLEFARINGRETLLPAIPVDGQGRATRELEISALFNQGNILPDSYREEFLDYGDNTRDLIATAIYRDTTSDDMFPRNNSLTIALADTRENDAIMQTFDLSDWVTQREQAELYIRFMCQQRRYLKKGIEFKTVPSDTPIGPGEYVFVDIALNKWDQVLSGIVEADGRLNVPLTTSMPEGRFIALTYRSGDLPREEVVNLSGGAAPELADREGCLFVLGRESTAKRVFRITEVTMDETGETTVKGVEYPTELVAGRLLSLVHDFRASLFREIGATC